MSRGKVNDTGPNVNDGRAANPEKPCKAYSRDEIVEQAKIKHKSKIRAASPTVEIQSDNQWKQLSTHWGKATEDERKDICFGMALHIGAKPKDLSRLFAIKPDELKPYTEVMNQAVAALRLKVQQNQLTTALMSDQPNLKFFLGKQFAEQVENPAHDGVVSDQSDGEAITITVVNRSDAADAPQVIATKAGVGEVLQ